MSSDLHDLTETQAEDVSPLVYVAGPYAAPTRAQIDRNVARACALGRLASVLGFIALVPHAIGRLGCIGDPSERDDGATRLRALKSGEAMARLVGGAGGSLWVIETERGGLSAGTAREVDAFQAVDGPLRRVQQRAWAGWVQYAERLGVDLERSVDEIYGMITRDQEDSAAGSAQEVLGRVCFRNRVGRTVYLRLQEGDQKWLVKILETEVGASAFAQACELQIFDTIRVLGREMDIGELGARDDRGIHCSTFEILQPGLEPGEALALVERLERAAEEEEAALAEVAEA